MYKSGKKDVQFRSIIESKLFSNAVAYVDRLKKINRCFLNVHELIFFGSLSVRTEVSMINMFFCGNLFYFAGNWGHYKLRIE